MKAVRLKQVDDEYRIHLQAYQNVRAKATRKSGKKSVPVYSKFKKFFNYEKRVKEVLNEEQSDSSDSLSEFSKKFLKKGEK